MAIFRRRPSNGGRLMLGRYEEIAIFDQYLAIRNYTRYSHIVTIEDE